MGTSSPLVADLNEWQLSGDARSGLGTARLVKVFGCRQASENRPSTNPRGCGDGLWGFCVLPG